MPGATYMDIGRFPKNMKTNEKKQPNKQPLHIPPGIHIPPPPGSQEQDGPGAPANPFKPQVPRTKVACPIFRESSRCSMEARKPSETEGYLEKRLKSRKLPQTRISKWPRKPGL